MSTTHYNSVRYTSSCVDCLPFLIITRASRQEGWSPFCSGLDPRAWHRDGAQLVFREQMCVASSSPGPPNPWLAPVTNTQLACYFLHNPLKWTPAHSITSHFGFSSSTPDVFWRFATYLKRAGTSHLHSQLYPQDLESAWNMTGA